MSALIFQRFLHFYEKFRKNYLLFIIDYNTGKKRGINLISDFWTIWIPLSFSVVGSLIIIYGGIRAAIKTLIAEIRRETYYYADIRFDFTSKIALGLEFFIAGDLIKTIIEPNFTQITTLAVIVGIRTVIGYFLDKESRELKRAILENKQRKI